MKLLLSLFVLCFSYSDISSNIISLRPKPKARAGGADGGGAPVFSFTYTSHVFIGSNEGLFTLTIAVLQNDIWVMDPDCENCKITFIQYNHSSTDTSPLNKSVSYESSELNIEAEGKYISDLIRIGDSNSTIYPIAVADKFIDVYGIAIDGILGLGKDNSSIIYQMYKEEKLDAPIYSLSFLSDPYLILGTPNFLDLLLVIHSQETISFEGNMTVSSFTFGSNTIEQEIPFEFSSASSFISGPPEVLESVFKTLSEEGCHYEEEMLMCECGNEEYPTFDFTIQGKVFSLTSHQYLTELGENCFLAMKSAEYWILGEPFFKGFFAEFNLENKKLTLYQTSALEMERPSPFDTTEGWAAMISLGIGSLAIYVVAFIIYLQYERYQIASVKVRSHELVHLKPRML